MSRHSTEPAAVGCDYCRCHFGHVAANPDQQVSAARPLLSVRDRRGHHGCALPAGAHRGLARSTRPYRARSPRQAAGPAAGHMALHTGVAAVAAAAAAGQPCGGLGSLESQIPALLAAAPGSATLEGSAAGLGPVQEAGRWVRRSRGCAA